MYPSNVHWRDLPSCASGVSACTFYWHKDASTSEALVSHRNMATQMLMQLSVARRVYCLSDKEKEAEKHICGDGDESNVLQPPPVQNKPNTGCEGHLPSVPPPPPLLPPPLSVREQEVMSRVNPLNLPEGGYLSMFSSLADYTVHTRCHRTIPIARDAVVEHWLRLVRCVSDCLFSGASSSTTVTDSLAPDVTAASLPNCRSLMVPPTVAQAFEPCRNVTRRLTYGAASISGVYVHRYPSGGAFELGIVTHGTRPHSEVMRLVADLKHHVRMSFPHVNNILPIGAALRTASLRVWWDSASERVMPGVPLHPIQAFVTQPLHPTDTSPAFHGYESVGMVLIHPVTSRLQGRQHVLLPHGDDEEPEPGADGSPPPRFRKSYRKGSVRRWKANHHHSISAYGDTSPSSHDVPVWEARLTFAGLSVSTVGEHLLAVEVRPKAEYRPFLPTLSQHVHPFLVVPHDVSSE